MRTLHGADDPKTAPTRKQSNPFPNAISTEVGSAGVAKNDAATATNSQIQSGVSQFPRAPASGATTSPRGAAYGLAECSSIRLQANSDRFWAQLLPNDSLKPNQNLSRANTLHPFTPSPPPADFFPRCSIFLLTNICIYVYYTSRKRYVSNSHHAGPRSLTTSPQYPATAPTPRCLIPGKMFPLSSPRNAHNADKPGNSGKLTPQATPSILAKPTLC